LALLRPRVRRSAAAGVLLGARAADEEDGPFLGATVTAAVSPVTQSHALTTRCTVCAAHGIYRGHSSESAFFTFDPESDVEKQMSLSRTPKRCKKPLRPRLDVDVVVLSRERRHAEVELG